MAWSEGRRPRPKGWSRVIWPLRGRQNTDNFLIIFTAPVGYLEASNLRERTMAISSDTEAIVAAILAAGKVMKSGLPATLPRGVSTEGAWVSEYRRMLAEVQQNYAQPAPPRSGP